MKQVTVRAVPGLNNHGWELHIPGPNPHVHPVTALDDEARNEVRLRMHEGPGPCKPVDVDVLFEIDPEGECVLAINDPVTRAKAARIFRAGHRRYLARLAGEEAGDTDTEP